MRAGSPIARWIREALLPTLALTAIAACTSWKQAGRFDGFDLYVRDGSPVDPLPYARAIEPALRAVEQAFGPFQGDVRVHAWSGGVELESGNAGWIRDGADPIAEVPGIGPARVRAFHSGAGSGGASGPGRGVYLGEPDAGTAVHELVHARLSELGVDVPLWLEEGLASTLGDGALYGDAWRVDGFAYWPWSELRAQSLTDSELARLLSLRARDDHSVRENLLVHFLGWALVRDVSEQDPASTPLGWIDAARAIDTVAEARASLARTLDAGAALRALRALDDPDPGRRLAAVRGAWKAGGGAVFERLAEALAVERDPEVRAALAVNLAAGATRAGRFWWRARRSVLNALRETELPDPEETAALRLLQRAHRGREPSSRAAEALEVLRRFWDE